MRTLLFLILVVVYVLSAQPVTLLVVSNSHPLGMPGWLSTLYAPVGWLHDRTPLKSPLDAWAKMWLSAFNPTSPPPSSPPPTKP